MNYKTRLVCTLLATTALCAPVSAGVNSWTLNSPDGASLGTIAVHPTRPSVIIAGSSRGVYRTSDEGATWTLVRDDVHQPTAIVFDPHHPDDVYLTNGYVYRSTDAGLTFTRGPDGSPNGVGHFSIAANGDLFAGSYDGFLFRSQDRGQTWTTLPHPWTPQVQMTTLTVDPNNAATLYVTIDYVGTFKSVNSGANWTGPVAGSPGTDVGVQTPRWVFSFAVQPGNSNRLLAGTSRGILVSNDGGATWTEAAFMELAFWIGFDPFDATRVMAFSNMGVMRSSNGGLTWPLAQAGARIHTAAYDAAPDPSAPNRLWVAGADGPLLTTDWGNSVSLRATGMHAGFIADFTASSDGTIYAAMIGGPRGVYLRTPAGWQPLNNTDLYEALPSIVNLASVSTPPAHPDILYVANYFSGLSTSMDGGDTWTPASWAFQWPAQMYLTRVVADPTSSTGAVSFVATNEHGIWKSTDFGVNWIQGVGLPNYIRAVAVDPADGNVVYAAGGAITSDGLYKSENGGLSWTASGTVLGSTESITVDPANSNVVYAVGSQLLKSTNAGGSWTPMEIGTYQNFVNGRRLLIDPMRSSTLFLVNGEQSGSFKRSVDGGATWEETSYQAGNALASFEAAILDPLHPNVLIAGASNVGIVEYEIAPDLSVTLTGVTTPLATGASAQAMVSVSNAGPHASSLATVRITLPAWLTATLPAGCTQGGAVITCERAAVRVGQTVNIPLALIASDTPSTGQLIVSVSGHERDPVAGNNQVTLNASSTEQADLELALVAGTLSLAHGTTTTLNATVTNRGPSPSSATELVLNVPAGVTAQVALSAGNCGRSGGTITCTLGTIAANGTATIPLTLSGDTVGGYTLSGQVDGAGLDTDGDQNASLALNVLPVGDASVELSDAPDPVRVNEPLHYTATVRNLGTDPGAIVVSMTLSGTAVTAASTASGTCTNTATSVTCNLTALAGGGSALVNIEANASAPGAASATATAIYAGVDLNAANNSATVDTTVRLVGDVGVTVTDSADPAIMGVPYTYTVTVRNSGPNAGAVSVTVPVTGVTVTAATLAGGTCTRSASSATCDIATLASNTSAILSLTVNASTTGTAGATATATFAGTDPDATNNSATANTTVNAPPAPSSSSGSGGGGGGGGRLDWLLATLLGGLLARRAIRSRPGAG